MIAQITIIGGGLAGSEAAWQVAKQGIKVRLFEMRPSHQTGAHQTGDLAELVCSNSLGSNLPDRASGLLKEELRLLGSFLLQCAEKTALPAGGALAVDREAFAKLVTSTLAENPNIEIVREEVQSIPNTPTIIASGPLTSEKLSQEISVLSGEEHLYFFDALAPIVSFESVDRGVAFRGERYGEDGDYLNCPLNQTEYEQFVDALLSAKRIPLKSFEEQMTKGVKTSPHTFFEGCLPIEIIAERGRNSLAFGPMRPIGLIDPRTNKRPHAVVQLRQDNVAGSLYNLVGFQTNLTFSEQERVLRLIPGLEKAEFIRFGQMHRNTFINAPKLLHPTLQFKKREDLFFAGQLTGVEGYMGNVGTGLIAGRNAAQFIKNEKLTTLPPTTMLGALCHYVSHAEANNFQPMKANFGILPPLELRLKKNEKGGAYAKRALEELKNISLPQGF